MLMNRQGLTDTIQAWPESDREQIERQADYC